MLYELGMGGVGISKPIRYFESKANVFDIVMSSVICCKYFVSKYFLYDFCNEVTKYHSKVFQHYDR